MSAEPPAHASFRRSPFAGALNTAFSTLAQAGRLFPQSRPERHGLELLPGIAYREGGGAEHQLDVWRPVERAGPLPGVVYFHGGAFSSLSKETHWLMGIAFARRGYVVFNVNYRLSPQHRYPCAIEDACTAWSWVAEHAAEYGADPRRLAVAGESAGANLALGVVVASAWDRPEPWARAVFDGPALPRAALPACGVLQVSDIARLHRRRPLVLPVRDVLSGVERTYLPADRAGVDLALADPLCVVETIAPRRVVPPFFLPVGTRDPLLDDTRRLAAALGKLGVRADARYYPGEMHAFHAFVWRPQARACWNDMHAFLREEVRGRRS